MGRARCAVARTGTGTTIETAVAHISATNAAPATGC